MRLRGAIKKLLCENVPGFMGSFRYFGEKIYFPKGSITFEAACRDGVYEGENTRLSCKLVKPNSVYFDIGGNIGLMAVPVLKDCDSCRVYSFEPSPNTLEFLRKTVAESRYRDRWTLIEKAVADQPGQLEFNVNPVAHGALDGFRNTGRAQGSKKAIVDVVTIDWEWVALGRPKVSLIKIDIEGAELNALRGASECIAGTKPAIIVEWNEVNLRPYGCDTSELLKWAKGADYNVLSLPDFMPISGKTLLSLRLADTESFLLLPKFDE